MAGLLDWFGGAAKSVERTVRDVFDANTEEDQRKRMAAGQQRFYQDQQRQKQQQAQARQQQIIRQANPTNITKPILGVTIGDIAREIPSAVNQITQGSKDVAKGFVANPIKVGKLIAYPIIQDDMSKKLDRGEISYDTYNKIVTQAADEAGIGINDDTGTVARKVGGAVGGTALDILTAGSMSPKAAVGLKTGVLGKAAPYAAPLANRVAAGVGTGALLGGANLMQRNEITPEQAAIDIGGGAAIGGAFPAALAGFSKLTGKILPKAAASAVDAPTQAVAPPPRVRVINGRKVFAPRTNFADDVVPAGPVGRPIAQNMDDLQIRHFQEPTKAQAIDPDMVSRRAKNSLFNDPSTKFDKPNRLQGEGYSYLEAETGKTVGGEDLDGRITIGKNDNGDIILKDGTHLVEAHRERKIPIEPRKFRFEDGASMKDLADTPELRGAALQSKLSKEADPSMLGSGRIGNDVPDSYLEPKPGMKNRGTIETVKSSPVTKPELADMLTSQQYKELPNTKTLSDAVETINKDPQTALNNVLSTKPRTAQLNAQALILAEKAQQRGDFRQAQEIFQAMAPGNTQQGQAIQILSVWSKTKPEGVVKYAQKVVDDANNIIVVKGGSPKYTLPPEKAQMFREIAQEIEKMPEGHDKLIATQQMLNAIHQQIPASILTKLQSSLYYAQLLNPKTAIRNIVGNTGMVVSENIKDTVGAPIDAALTGIRRIAGDKTAQRSVYLPNIPGQIKAAWQGGRMAAKEASAGVNLSGQEGQLQIGMRQPAFTGKAGQWIDRTMQKELSVPDRAFFKAREYQTLRNLMRGAGVDKPTKEMMETAQHDALVATFQDDSAASKVFVKIKQGLNANKEFGVGSFVLNYPKTPGNLLSRGIDYSPAGFVKATVDIAKPLFGQGAFNQKAFVDNFSRALTGTVGLVGTGALMHKIGIITGAPDKDKDVNALDRQAGLGAYRINTSALKRFIESGFDVESAKLQDGDKLVSYDWFQPAAIGISMGANLDETQASNKGSVGKLMSMFGSAGTSIAAGAETLAQQPLVQGLTKLTGYGDIVSGFVATAVGVPASFVPTLLNQVNQLVDNTARSTYDPNPAQEAVNKAKAKIPGLASTLQPQVGTMGEDNERFVGGKNSFFNVFFNPAFVSNYDANSVNTEIKRLEDTTGQKSQYPATVSKTQKVNGTDVKLSPEQLTDMQRTQGELTRAAFNGIMKDPGYAKLSDTDRVKRLQNIITEANAIARIKVLGDVADSDTDKSVLRGVNSGKVEYSTSPSGSGSSGISPKQKYEEELATYETEKKQGLISDIQDIGRQRTLTKLRAQQDSSADAVELYSKSYKDIVAFVNENKNGKTLWDEIKALDKKMTDAGYTSKLYDKYGRPKRTTKGGSKGRKRTSRAKLAKATKRYSGADSSIKQITSGTRRATRPVASLSGPRYSVKSLPKIKPGKRYA